MRIQRSRQLTDDVLTRVLALQQGLKVVIIALAASVIEDLAGTGDSVVPVPTDGLLAVSETEWLGADGFWSSGQLTERSGRWVNSRGLGQHTLWSDWHSWVLGQSALAEHLWNMDSR